MSRAVFEDVLYAQCWEDPQIDREAFRMGPDDVVFSITSGGCNVLAFLLDDPRRVIALDYNASQSHVLALKIAALKTLEHHELLAFVGARPATDRVRLYTEVRGALDDGARAFWDARVDKIRLGLLHAGRFEAYLRLVRTWVRRIVGRELVDTLLSSDSRAEREHLYRRRWDTRRWRALTGFLLSRGVLTLLFDRAFFAQIETPESFGANFRTRLEHALTQLPVRENPFLTYMLTGRFKDGAALPQWLRPEHHASIRDRVDRIEIVSASCLDWLRAQPDDTVTRFNFTNIFEWVSEEGYAELLEETTRVGRDGAVLTYRNLLVGRRRPDALAGRIEPQEHLAASLHDKDLSFIYRRYVVETVRKAATCAA